MLETTVWRVYGGSWRRWYCSLQFCRTHLVHRQEVKALSQFGVVESFNDSIPLQQVQAQQQLQQKLLASNWAKEALLLEYPELKFSDVDVNEQKYVCLLGEAFRDLDWTIKSIREWTVEIE